MVCILINVHRGGGISQQSKTNISSVAVNAYSSGAHQFTHSSINIWMF